MHVAAYVGCMWTQRVRRAGWRRALFPGQPIVWPPPTTASTGTGTGGPTDLSPALKVSRETGVMYMLD